MSIPVSDWKAEVRRRIRRVPLAGERQAAIVEEIAQDLEARYAGLLQNGMDDLAARAQVLGELDSGPGLDYYLSDLERRSSPVSSRLDGRGSAVESLHQDCRFAVRAFRRRPLFTAVAVAAIAIGVASLTTVFSLLNTVLIRALPLSRFDDIVMVWQQDLTTGRDRMTLSGREWQAYGRARSFDAVAAIRGLRLSVGTGSTPLAASGIQVSSALFDTLGVTPILGRGLSRSNEAATDEVVITSEFWRNHFGADPAILGRALTIRAGFTADPDGAARFIDGPRLVVGVLPDGLSLPYRAADVWLPLPPQAETDASASAGLLVFARLAPGVTLPAASAETATIARGLLAQFPERDPHVESRLVTLREEVVGDVTPTLILLSAAVMLLSLIVCANVGNMLLSRLTERQREITVRRALGATRGRLVQQLLTESVVLGAAGGAVGVLLSHWLLRGLATAGPATIPRVGDLRLDLWTLGAAVVASILMSIVFGLLPALRIVRMRGNQLAQRSGNTAEAGRLRELLTIAEFALAFVVLVGAGLVYVSSRALETTSVGYDPTSSLTLRVALPQDGYTRPEQRAAFFETLLDRFGALPGVTHAGAVSILPQMDTNRTLAFDLDSAASGASPDRPSARFRVATPGYFESLGIRVVRGRTFQRSDLAAGAVVVSQSLAERFWPSTDPVGRQVRLALPAGPGPWLTVVGVVEDVRQWINTPPDPTLYWANTQQAEFALVLRTTADPSTLSTAAARMVRDLDPQQPVFDVQTMRERLDRSQQLTYERFRTTIMGAFGLIALLLAGLGIYGVVRYAVIQRTQEFGIRIALGASPREVFSIVLRQSLRSTVAGCTIGLLGSMALGRLLAGVLYGGVSAQPFIIIAVGVLLAAISAAAAAGPARRASRVDPLIALRSE
jgi:putative ABC transport system permease protein